MGRIFKDLKLFGSKGVTEVKQVLLDSGTTRSLISEEKAKAICTVEPPRDSITGEPRESIDVHLGDKATKMKGIGYCHFTTNIEGRAVEDNAVVVEDLRRDMVIGAQTLQLHNINLIHRRTGKDGKSQDRIELGKMDDIEMG